MEKNTEDNNELSKSIEEALRDYRRKIARLGGKSSSLKKKEASKENGKKGGRPRKMVLISIILVFISFISCAENCPVNQEAILKPYLIPVFNRMEVINIYLTGNYNNGNIITLQSAIHTWNSKLGREVLRWNKEGAFIAFSYVNNHTDEADELRITDCSALGVAWLNQSRCEIYITEKEQYNQEVYEHEIGHCLNLGHSTNKDSRMFPYLYPHQQTITQESVDIVNGMIGANPIRPIE